MFEELEIINTRPKPFEFYTASDLWTDEHTSKQRLSFHLNEEIDVSSRNGPFIDSSVEWITSCFNVGAGVKIADFGTSIQMVSSVAVIVVYRGLIMCNMRTKPNVPSAYVYGTKKGEGSHLKY